MIPFTDAIFTFSDKYDILNLQVSSWSEGRNYIFMSDQNERVNDRPETFVDEAIHSMNFDRLNQQMNQSISTIFKELDLTKSSIEARHWRASADGKGYVQAGTPAASARQRTASARSPRGELTGIILTALGAAFSVIFGISSIVVGMLGAAIPGFALAQNISLAVLLPLLAISLVCFGKGLSMHGRAGRYKKYINVIGSRTYCPVSELSAAVGRSRSYTARDLQKMIDRGFFPGAHLDAGQNTLILDESTYQQYLQTMQAYQEKERMKAEDAGLFTAGSGSRNPDLDRALEEGKNYLAQIRAANEAIPEEAFSRKLDKMEDLIRKIFALVKEKPDQLYKLRRFMKYYMPTTIKLLNAYEELDSQPVEGENIRKSKQEIRDTVDTINSAYEKLLDSFFEESTMDIHSDISVLQTMFAQEGLNQSPFEEKKEKKES